MRYALVTGASGALGRAAVEALQNHDYFVFAADIKPFSCFPTQRCYSLSMDITDADSVIKAVNVIKGRTAGLDLVVNIAGRTAVGPLIEQDPEVMCHQMKVRLLGPMLVNKEVFPLVRYMKGRYINISSDFAVTPVVPFNAHYAIANRAVEGYNEGLRREMYPFGIQVVLLRLGSFSTRRMKNTIAELVDQSRTSVNYADALMHVTRWMESYYLTASKPAAFVKTFMKAALSPKPKRVYDVRRNWKQRWLKSMSQRYVDRYYQNIFD